MHNTLHRLQVKHKTLSAVNKDPTSSNVRQWNKFTGAWGITATAYNTRQLVCICSASYVSCEHDAACVCCWAQAVQQLINISCPPGAQQQSKPSATECRGRMMGETDRQRDAWPLRRSCYDTRSSICYFDVRLKANMSQLNLPHGTTTATTTTTV